MEEVWYGDSDFNAVNNNNNNDEEEGESLADEISTAINEVRKE